MDVQQTDAKRQRILLVDDEEALTWSLSNRTTKVRPGYAVQTANDGQTALELLKAAPPDLLITDISMDGMRGTELIMVARQLIPDLPVIVITAYPTSELRQQARQGSIEYLEKPFEFELFLSTMDSVLERRHVGFSGAISVQTLPDIVQLYALANASGALCVWHRAAEGMIWFEQGSIIHASTSRAVGADAFHEIMLWSGGSFSMRLGDVAPERSIRASWTELLMESCRLLDERRRPTDATGPTSLRGWSLTEITGTAVNEADHASMAPPPGRFDSVPAPPSQGNDHLIVDMMFGDEIVPAEEIPMDYKHATNKLTTIDGFIGAALVDSESGMLLSQEGGGPINLEVAGASNAEVVRAKRKAMRNLNIKDEIEDILISLSKHYHLIRPVRQNPALFFYLVLERSRANLAMARLTLAEVEKGLT